MTGEIDSRGETEKQLNTIMKHFLCHSLGAAFVIAALATSAGAEPADSGYVDFGKLSAPASGGEFVEVNISSNLISLVATLAKDSEPEVTDLVHGLQHIRVNVIGLDDGNRSELQERVKKLRGELDSQGWERVVTAQQKDQDVVVQLKTRGGEAIQGLVVTVINGTQQAVLVNIVGDIKPDKIAAIGRKLNIDPLKHLPPLGKT
jgi:hypothetical protein